MDINMTLFGEMITFAILVWATMKYIWPPLTKAMQERQQKIASGLAAAERGQHALEIAQKNVAQQLQKAKDKAASILDQAHQQATNVIEEGRVKAQDECTKILAKAKLDLEQEINKTKQELQHQTAGLVIDTVEKVLQQKIDSSTQQKLVKQVITEIQT
jgi:F-type H+-transporting ATPase subunit b